MERRALLASVLVLALLVAAQRVDSQTQTIQVGTLSREYVLHVPPDPQADKPFPLVFVFHGGGGVAATQDRLTRFVALSQRERFVVVHPQGIGRSWNDGRVTQVTRAHREGVDDLAFFDALLATISKDHPIDAKRVYATGISNGAIFSHYLAANRADLIAAIAPVVGGLADPFHKAFRPAAPVSVLILQGTADPLVPYEGGAIKLGDGGERGRIIATDDTIKLWIASNDCDTEPVVAALPDRDPQDACTVQRSTWSKGKANSEVQLLRIQQGGHTWPGGPQYLPQRVIGRVCRDFDATTEIWEFFKAHPKP